MNSTHCSFSSLKKHQNLIYVGCMPAVTSHCVCVRYARASSCAGMRGSRQPDLHWTWSLNIVIRIVVCCQQSESRISLWDWREVRRKKPSLFDYDGERSPWVELSLSNDNWPQKFPSGEEPGEYWWRRGWKDTSHLRLEIITHTNRHTRTRARTYTYTKRRKAKWVIEGTKESENEIDVKEGDEHELLRLVPRFTDN